MISIRVYTRDGTARTISVDSGGSLMEALHSQGFDEVQAIGGGCCSCGTCHVYVEAPLASLYALAGCRWRLDVVE
jgi:ferredoxin